jgi:hypothetical protein
MTVAQAGGPSSNDERDDEAPIDPARRAQLLNDCQQLVIARLSDAIAEALKKVGDDLAALALRNTNPDAQQALLDAVTLVRRRHAEIQSSFRELFADIFVQRVHGRTDDEAPSEIQGLALVDDSVIEEKIAIDRIIQRVRSKLDPDEVLGIRARLGVLAAGDWFDETRHPASPEAVFEALRQTLAQLDADAGVRDALLEAIEPHVSSNLGAIYTTVNERLRDSQVLPRIRPRIVGVRPAAGAVAPTAPVAAPADLARGGQSWTAGVAQVPSQPTGQYPSQGEGAMTSLVPGAGNLTWAAGSSDPGAGLADLLDGLEHAVPQARRAAIELLADPRRFADFTVLAPPPLALLRSLSSLQMSRLRSADDLRTEGRDKGSALDRLTIDMVAGVFDRLYADRRLPDSIKQQLLRLQVLAVKAALIDRGFFARADHPMRRLLDAICRAASDPDADVRPDSSLVQGLAELVDWLIASFDTELSVFADALARLELLLSIESQRRAERDRGLARQAERLEAFALAQERARAEVIARTGDAVPLFVIDFLQQYWTRVMASARIGAGEHGWREALACMEALLWSVSPKTSAEVPRLAGLLPKLIAELNRGIARSGIDKAAKDRFFNDLLQRHTEVIQHARLDGGATRTHFAVPQAPRPGPEGSPRDGAAGMPDAVPTVAPEISRRLTALAVGETLELLEADGSRRLFRVSWLSPTRRLFVLTRFPDEARTVRREELVRWFANGRARTIGPDSAIERSLATLLADRGGAE